MENTMSGKIENYWFSYKGKGIVPGNSDVAFFKNENQIICTIKESEHGYLYFGVASCHPEDEFDWKTGSEIAYNRAKMAEGNEDADYSHYYGRVVCMNNYYGFHKGGIYQVKNGSIYDDDNDDRQLHMAISKYCPYDELNKAMEEIYCWFVPID